MKKGTTQRCPVCGCKLAGIVTDWHLKEKTISGHRVATIGTPWNATESLAASVEFQIASNLAAYDLDYDAEISLGFRGRAWVQCPKVRQSGVSDVCIPK